MRLVPWLLIFTLLNSASIATAQSKNEGGEVEALYDQFEREEEKRKVRRRKKRLRPNQKREKEILKLSDLADLNPFSDVAVISRRYLPKTGRFELGAIAAFGINNPFFNNVGGAAQLAYFFSDSWAVEGGYFFLADSEKDITTNLKEQSGVATESLVVPQSFAGAWIKWAPIYGKMAWFDSSVVPYDMYFRLGGGLTTTKVAGGEPTISMGVGQIFALSKAFALRWDLLGNFYNATIETDDGSGSTSETTSHTDIFLTIGISFFFPEATYR